MRIIYYSPHPTHDIVSEVGYATHQREVILALQALGHEVLPVIMGGTEKSNLNPKTTVSYQIPFYKKIIKAFMPRFIWTSLNNHKLLLHDKKAAAALETAIKKFNPDLIYERSEYLQDSGALTAKKYKLKYFLEVNAPFVEEMNQFEGFSLYHKLAHKKELIKLNAADKVFTVSSALSNFLQNRYNCKKDKIILQANCINPSKYQTDEQLISELKAKFESSQNTVIGFVGSMFPYHGVDILIKAFSQVLQSIPNLKLLIVGDGIVLEDLKKLASDYRISDKVIFAGKIPHENVFNYIAAMDICIMAKSNWYGSPVKIFEYGLMKKPIIAPATNPVKDVMEDMQDAIIIEENEESLSKAIRTLLTDQILAGRLATNFHLKVLQKYTWTKAAEKIIEQCT